MLPLAAREASDLQRHCCLCNWIKRMSRGKELVRRRDTSRSRVWFRADRGALAQKREALAICASVLVAAACSDMASGGESFTCVSEGTCGETSQAVENDPRWSCLGAAETPRPESSTGNVDYTLPIVDYLSQAPAGDLSIQRCSKQDAGCLNGLGLPLTSSGGNNSPNVTISLERSFGRNNYLLVTSTNVVGTVAQDINGDGIMPDPDIYIPYAYYFGDTVYETRSVAPDFQLLRVSDVGRLSATSGIAVNPARSVIIVRAYDCLDQPAPNVQFAISYVGDDMGEAPTPYTIYGGLPFPPPPGEEFLPTDLEGQGGFVNVPFGNVQVSATVDDRPIGPLEGVTATAVPGQITVVEVHTLPYGKTASTPD
jgi:hypothetical protein